MGRGRTFGGERHLRAEHSSPIRPKVRSQCLGVGRQPRGVGDKGATNPSARDAAVDVGMVDVSLVTLLDNRILCGVELDWRYTR